MKKNKKKIMPALIALALIAIMTLSISFSVTAKNFSDKYIVSSEQAENGFVDIPDSENAYIYEKEADGDFELVIPDSENCIISDSNDEHVVIHNSKIYHNDVELNGSVSKYNSGEEVTLDISLKENCSLSQIYIFDSTGTEIPFDYDTESGRITFAMPESDTIVTTATVDKTIEKREYTDPETINNDDAEESTENIEESITSDYVKASGRLKASARAASQGSRTVSEVLGISTDTLIYWLKSHENDSYYLGTPYKYAGSAGSNGTSDWRNPNGDPTGYGFCTNKGVGLQCTGFVWHVLVSAGSNPWNTPNLAKQYDGTAAGGWAAFVWNNNVKHYEFSSKSEMLASGVLEKGDIIASFDLSTGGAGSVANDHHVGFFWGDTSNQDKYWHSGPREDCNKQTEINCISAINRKTANVNWWVIKLGGVEPIYKTTSYTARDAISPSLDIHIEKADADTGKKLAGAEFAIYMDGTKKGTVTTDENGKAAYHWRGDPVYTAYQTSSAKTYCINYDDLNAADRQAVSNNSSVYNDASSAYNAAKKEAVSKVSQAVTALKANTKHIWKVVETKAPDGYELNTGIWEQTLAAGVTAIEIDFTDVITEGYLKLTKTSGNTSLTEGNDCYGLEDAEYGVYQSVEDAKNDTNREETLITDANGSTDTVKIRPGIWYVKEITASKGYKLCDESLDCADGTKDGIHMIEVTSDNTEDEPAVIECIEPPANNPFALTLQKRDYDTGESAAQGIASLYGAVFAVDYYTNTGGSISGNALRTWYFQTDEFGEINCGDEEFLVSDYAMGNGIAWKSSALYKDAEGNVIYPIGTYRIREVSPPMYYQNNGYMQFKESPAGQTAVTSGLKAVIKQDKNGGETHIYDGDKLIDGVITADNLFIYVYDKPEYGSITIYKQNANGDKEPLPGVTFKLVGVEEGDEYIAVTDKDGIVKWDNLTAQNYVITEIETVDGYSLLKDNIEVRLPMEMTLDQIDKSSADINQAVFDEVSRKYCFYDLSFTIDNSVMFKMPFTGANQKILYIILAAAFGLVTFGTILILRKKGSYENH